MQRLSQDDILDGLTEPQQQAVRHVDGPLLVLAGAGSGKTRTITRRTAYLASVGVAPSHIAAITFTNKAASEMRERIEAMLGRSGMTVCTFHSLCVRILRRYADVAGLKANFTILDQTDRKKAVKDCLSRAGLASDHFRPAVVESAISRAKNDMLKPDSFAEAASDFFDKTVARVYSAYEDYLAEINSLDFDDLLLRTAFLLRDHDDVRDELENRFGYVLIDEYQDTNRAQYLIARGLVKNNRNICATGDPDQSIYRWRGADLNNILDFETDYPDCTVVRLEQNYRSTKSILGAADRLISANVHRKSKSLWTENPDGSAVSMFFGDDSEAEAHEVARRIRTQLNPDRRPSDIALFYRVNSMTRVLEEALRFHKIPYQIARGTEFYARKEVKDTLAYLRILSNPADAVSLDRVINVPARGIGKATVGRLLEFARTRRIAAATAIRSAAETTELKRAKKKLTAFADLLDRLDEKAKGSVAGLVESVLKETGLDKELREQSDPDNDRYGNAMELVNVAALYDGSAEEPSLEDFLQEIALVSDVDSVDPESGAVTLMTLHAAKGLEFPVVYIVGLEDGLIPHERSRDDEHAIEEERRLLFVGITRAKEELTLSFARMRMRNGSRSCTFESRFVRDLPLNSLDVLEQPVANPNLGRFGSRRFDGRRSMSIEEWEAQANRRYDDDYSQVPEQDALERAIRNEAAVDPRLQEGRLVEHPEFGMGRIQSVQPMGKRTRVLVHFNRAGLKPLVVPPAQLEPVIE
jgi:DNA helicase-2/ATP-dependent DNA helicase PcrA